MDPGRSVAWRDKAEFIRDVRSAVARGDGFAAAKLGHSEHKLLRLQLPEYRVAHGARRRALELGMQVALRDYSGIFPPTFEFYLQYGRFFAAAVAELDYIGLFGDEIGRDLEARLVAANNWPGKYVHYRDQEPDRSVPSDPSRCYLDAFRGKRLLLICPFAEVLRARATRETFETVWGKTGKRWFEPSSVAAVEFPYGWSPRTWERYATVRDLLSEIEHRIAAESFDVALIAAGGIGIPLAAFVKRIGKTAIALGGHLQPLFGVRGKRWRDDPTWRRDYLNDAWVDLPARYLPDNANATPEYW